MRKERDDRIQQTMKRFSPLFWFILLAFSAGAQLPLAKVRFSNPQFVCSSHFYYLDVELQSNTPNETLYGMNVRFFFDGVVLEYQSMQNFLDGYSPVAPVPPAISTSNTLGGPALFGFPAGHPFKFFNGAIQLTGTSTVTLSTTGWTKIFTICFHVIDQASMGAPDFCPSVIWDLEADPANGGWLNGDDGLVVTVVAPPPAFSAPTTENVIQFNWQYNPVAGATPYGFPSAMSCIPALPVPFNVTGTGVYCTDSAGRAIGLSGSQSGKVYTMTPGNVIRSGTGGPLTFGIFPAGSYAVAAVDTVTGCTNTMTGPAVVTMVQCVVQNSTVTGTIVAGQTTCYNAMQTLTVGGAGNPFTEQPGANVTLISGHNIRFLPGASVLHGGYLHGYITTTYQWCGQQSPSLVSTVTGDQEIVADKKITEFVIYPNPAIERFTVEQIGGPVYDHIDVKICGSDGKQIKKLSLSGQKKYLIESSGLPCGIYFVKLTSDTYITTIKLIKTE